MPIIPIKGTPGAVTNYYKNRVKVLSHYSIQWMVTKKHFPNQVFPLKISFKKFLLLSLELWQNQFIYQIAGQKCTISTLASFQPLRLSLITEKESNSA